MYLPHDTILENGTNVLHAFSKTVLVGHVNQDQMEIRLRFSRYQRMCAIVVESGMSYCWIAMWAWNSIWLLKFSPTIWFIFQL